MNPWLHVVAAGCALFWAAALAELVTGRSLLELLGVMS